MDPLGTLVPLKSRTLACSFSHDPQVKFINLERTGNIGASIITYIMLGVPYDIYPIKDPETPVLIMKAPTGPSIILAESRPSPVSAIPKAPNLKSSETLQAMS